jgi:formate/nitrite transporter FocA (FNT family)
LLAFLLVKHTTHNELLAGLAFSSGFIALTMARSELFTENFLIPVVAVVAKVRHVHRVDAVMGDHTGDQSGRRLVVDGIVRPDAA